MDLLAIEAFAKAVLEDDVTGHDWKHTLRVEKNARKLAPESLSDTEIEIVRAASWLHDTIDEKIDPLKQKSIKEVEQVLFENHATTDQTKQILFIIQNLSFSKNIDQIIKLDLLGQIVQDADRLDAIGAIGIARTFYYGGAKGNPLYDEGKPRHQSELTGDNYRNTTSVINQFYEKLLILEQQMNTPSGTAEAKKRTKVMRNFLKEFYREIYDV